MKRCILVFGTESSGTRLWTETVIRCGYFGDSTLEQRLDDSLDGAADNIVWRRSFPHADDFPDVGKMLERLRAQGFTDIVVYWTQRDRDCSIKSMLAAGHAKTEQEANRDIEEGLRRIGQAVRDHSLKTRIVRYERLISEPQYRINLLAAFGLEPQLSLPHLIDGNAKWIATSTA